MADDVQETIAIHPSSGDGEEPKHNSVLLEQCGAA